MDFYSPCVVTLGIVYYWVYHISAHQLQTSYPSQPLGDLLLGEVLGHRAQGCNRNYVGSITVIIQQLSAI